MSDNNPEIHVNDKGTEFLFTFVDDTGAAVNLGGAVSIKARFRDRRGRKNFEVDLSVVSAAAGTARYLTLADDLSVAGAWQVQGTAELSVTEKFHTNIHEFTVYSNLPTSN